MCVQQSATTVDERVSRDHSHKIDIQSYKTDKLKEDLEFTLNQESKKEEKKVEDPQMILKILLELNVRYVCRK
jgi:hypothetical protein